MTRDGMAEPVSPDQIFSRERGQGHTHFPCLADHEQDWQPCPVDLYSVCVHAHIYDDNPLLKTIYPRFILLSLQFTAFGKTPVFIRVYQSQRACCKFEVLHVPRL